MYHTARINVIGSIWQPGTGICATDYDMPVWPNDPPMTRDSVQDWLDTHAGDFQAITDFRAYDRKTDTLIDWQDEASICDYTDCMFPYED